MTIVTPSAAVSPPAFVIRVELESRPQVITDCVNEAEQRRLAFWLSTRPALLDLVVQAIELQDEARAA
jgi:hypothetical protein